MDAASRFEKGVVPLRNAAYFVRKITYNSYQLDPVLEIEYLTILISGHADNRHAPLARWVYSNGLAVRFLETSDKSPCPMKCPTPSMEFFQLKMPLADVEVGGQALGGAVVRRASNIDATISLCNNHCAEIIRDCDKIHKKILVQQERIKSHHVKMEKNNIARKRAEEEIKEVLSSYLDEMKKINQLRTVKMAKVVQNSKKRPFIRSNDIDETAALERHASKRLRDDA
ncbi:hypothetical protein C2E23DRAFT_857292 [Lenzites betulinus]|nr:hypothetical protein C2E23DRAFT_857292 [Lenzites betulinus]